MRGIERVPDIVRLNVKAIDVIEPTVPSLGNNRRAPPVAGLIGCALLNPPRNGRIARDADAVGIRNYDRPFEEAAILNPHCASHFAVAVEAKKARINRIIKRSVTARQNRRNPGAHRSFAHFKLSFTANQRRITDFDARDIGYRVQFSRRAFKRNPEISRANDLRLDWRR